MNDAIVAEEVADKIAEGEDVEQKTTVQQFLNELIAMNVHIIELTLRAISYDDFLYTKKV